MVDLVAGDAARLRRRDRPQDALALEMLERRLQRGCGHVGELAQLLGAQRDLPAARGHEEAERGGGGVALVGGELVHGVVEVPMDDRVRAAQTAQRLQPQLLGAGGELFVPEALHDELQVRGLDARGARGVDIRRPPSPIVTRPRRTCSSTASTSAGSTSKRGASAGSSR